MLVPKPERLGSYGKMCWGICQMENLDDVFHVSCLFEAVKRLKNMFFMM